MKSKTPSSLPYDKIHNETHNLTWLPSPRSYSSTGELNENSNSKITAYETQNGFVKFGGEVVFKTTTESPGKTSPAESGIYVNSPASAPLTPGGASNEDEAYHTPMDEFVHHASTTNSPNDVCVAIDDSNRNRAASYKL